MLTMGVYSEERKRGTMELLMTSPITETQIVLGKFLASLTLFAIMLLPTAGYLVFMYVRSEPVPPWRMLVAGYLGICCSEVPAGAGVVHFFAHGKPDHRRGADIRGVPDGVGDGLRPNARAVRLPCCTICPSSAITRTSRTASIDTSASFIT